MESPNPLIELKNINQREKGIFRRVFVDGDNDLTAWYDLDRHLIGFQLSIYDIAITFSEGRLTIHRINYCEKDNLAPILYGEAEVEAGTIIEYLNNNNQNMDKELYDYIISALGRKS